ncbi:hypothetical protein GCM10010260_10150 [Streptomyces filipinensis]|uniref:Uncharacterized protein n=1 Tax=Streptomyces filipinensis TaxID=66887 RepID=A0A918M8G2_9ACTN|nr:hypothetical protein GCM10010260_10150 [Streptomyces filipinensis]
MIKLFTEAPDAPSPGVVGPVRAPAFVPLQPGQRTCRRTAFGRLMSGKGYFVAGGVGRGGTGNGQKCGRQRPHPAERFSH